MATRTPADSKGFTLWCMTVAGKEARCVVVKAPTGFEAQMRVDGSLLYAHALPSLAEVAQWAEVRRSRMAALAVTQ